MLDGTTIVTLHVFIEPLARVPFVSGSPSQIVRRVAVQTTQQLSHAVAVISESCVIDTKISCSSNTSSARIQPLEMFRLAHVAQAG